NFLNAHHRPKLVFATHGTNEVVKSTGGTARIRPRQIGPFDELKDFIDSHAHSCALGLINSTQSVDAIVREYRPNLGFNSDCLAAAAARLVDKKHKRESEPPAFFLNYYGPPGSLPCFTNGATSGSQLAASLGGKVVFVGASQDLHRVPFNRRPYGLCYSNLSTGVEIQATAFLNLVTSRAASPRNSGGSWVIAADPAFERKALISFGILLGVLFSILPPLYAFAAVPVFAILAAAMSCLLLVTDNVALPWWIAAGPQVFFAFLIPTIIPVKSVFLSHRTDDGKTLAWSLTQRFRWRLGITVYFDEEDPMSGALTRRLKARVRQHGNFLLLITEELDRASTPFIDSEVEAAKESARNIVPVIVPGPESSKDHAKEMEARAKARWKLPPDLRFFQYEERTGRKELSEVGCLLDWSQPVLYKIAKAVLAWCIRMVRRRPKPIREDLNTI
ncbi:MAG: CHASE2 domain-containing protein, partial [Acidobacteria bacterium]|nr:CHASE2 domain-containing protein [Acidobacteriota bacterium]